MAATRVMENPRDRLLANLVIPFIPCNARLGVMAVMTAAFFPGAAGAVAMIGLIAVSLVILALVASIYRHTVLPTDPAPLVLELPRYHWPSLRTVLLATWHRVWLFLSRIWWFLIWATIAIWALTYFPSGQPLDRSYAAMIGHALAAGVGSHFGFDWRLMLAILFGFVAKETTLSTLGVLFGAGGGYLSLSHALARTFPPLVGFTYLVVYMLYVPCLSTVVQMRRESGGWGWAVLGVAVNVGVAFTVGYVVERVGQLLIGAT
jgi:ferrous iron transport protein B